MLVIARWVARDGEVAAVERHAIEDALPRLAHRERTVLEPTGD